MAFSAQQIYPIDFNKSAAVGVNIPFSGPGVFTPNYTTAAATSSITIILTATTTTTAITITITVVILLRSLAP